MYHYTKYFILGFLIGLLAMAGCSNSSSDGDKSSGKSLSGYAINGPLSGATVTVYDSNDFSVGSTKTDKDGYFSIEGFPGSPPYLVKAEGGTLYGQPYEGVLRGLFEAAPCNLTPLTTVTKEISRRNARDYGKVQVELMNWLELSEDPFIADFEGEPLEGIDLAAVREGVKKLGLESWIETLIGFYEDRVSIADFEAGWFGRAPADTTPERHLVDTVVGDGGVIDPETAEVDHEEVITFTVTPEAGFKIESVSGCDGNLAGDTYTTGGVIETCTIQVSFILKGYSVVFEDHDGTQLKIQAVNHGDSATAPADPTLDGYTFTGWDVGFNYVTNNLTVVAQYAIKQYTITFKDHDGTELHAETVNHGNSATGPAGPTREGYAFTGWDVEFDNVKMDMTVTAQYSKSEEIASLNELLEVIDEARKRNFPTEITILEGIYYVDQITGPILVISDYSQEISLIASGDVKIDGGGVVQILVTDTPLYIEGITFLNGYGLYGGAIQAANVEVEVRNSVFKNNTAERSGGSIYADKLYAYDSKFLNNEAHGWTGSWHSGGAIASRGGHISRSYFENNVATGSSDRPSGNSIYSLWDSHLVIENSVFVSFEDTRSNLFSNNQAEISDLRGQVIIHNSTFDTRVAAIGIYDAHAEIYSSILLAKEISVIGDVDSQAYINASYYNPEQKFGALVVATNNIIMEKEPQSFVDRENQDYQLLSNSKFIGAGVIPSYPLDLNKLERDSNKQSDLGAFCYCPD